MTLISVFLLKLYFKKFKFTHVKCLINMSKYVDFETTFKMLFNDDKCQT